MGWDSELTFYITPKSGPLRPMWTLRDVNRGLLDDLTHRERVRPHWMSVKRLLLIAADTGSSIDVRLCTESVLRAVEREGWMTRSAAGADVGIDAR
jgi:hypothetical protein